MHLASRQAQTIDIARHLFVFEPGETIHTENCYKYSMADFERIAQGSGWQLDHVWSDETGTQFKEILFKSI
jgi:uncharacterized SAM-dependent methyltransferase